MAAKSTYRVYIIAEDKYYSNGKKSSWTSPGYALDALTGSRYHYHETQIHEFPVTAAIVHNPLELKREIDKKREDAREKRKAAEEERRKQYLVEKAKREIAEAQAILQKYGKL